MYSSQRYIGLPESSWISIISVWQNKEQNFTNLCIWEFLTLVAQEFPTAFIRRYGKDMPKWVLLKVPSGETWTIDLEKHNGRVWLGKGWKNFVEYYCISAEYSITFGFVGNSMFHTVIFDESGQEIDYPIKCSCHKMPKHDDELPPPQKAKACEAMNIDMETTDEVDDDYYAFLSGLHVNIGTGMVNYKHLVSISCV